MSRKISAIAVLAILSGGGSAIAQPAIVPDATLGGEQSVVVPFASGDPIDVIEGGAVRGANLFHSFLRFNVEEGRGVFFDRFANTQNILVRVTGRESSNILGILGIVPLAGNLPQTNLFLINPNGILFGENARLVLPGSFFTTTANAIELGNAGLFSATEPARSSLLAVEPSAFLFSAIANQAEIKVQSSLRVPNGKTLSLLGGSVNIDGGRLGAWGGRVELGAISSEGKIGRNADQSLSIPSSVLRSDIRFQNGASADVRLGTGGTISISAKNITVSNSNLFTGIFSGGSSESLAGNLILDATGEIRVEQGSLISNNASAGSLGSGGNINVKANTLILSASSGIFTELRGEAEGRVTGDISIETGSISLINGAQIGSIVLGRGRAGNITVKARDSVIISGTDTDGVVQSGIRSTLGGLEPGNAFVGDAIVGQAGNISIQARSITLQDAGRLSTSTFGRGNSGNITLRADDQILLDNGATLLSNVSFGATGNGGAIDIHANSLVLNDAGGVLAIVRGSEEVSPLGVLPGGRGQAGNILITINGNMTIDGKLLGFAGGRPISQASIASSVAPGGKGQSGNINIQVGGKLTLTDFAGISSSLDRNANGQAQNIEINANSILLSNGAQINAFTEGEGSAGNIIINAQNDLSLDGALTSVFTGVLSNGVGNGSDIRVVADSLKITNGAQLAADTRGNGNAGNIFLGRENQPIRLISIAGTNTTDGKSSALFTSTNSNSLGGTIRVFADRFQLSDGAVVDARTFASGNSGTISLNANLVEILRGGQFLALTQGSGSSGKITIAANQLRVSGTDPTFEQRRTNFPTRVAPISRESGIYTRSIGSGSAGSIFVTGSQIQLDDRARIDAQSSTVDGGNISIRASDRLVLRNNSQISATAGTAQAPGNGGNIDISARFLIAIPKENSDIAANAFQGSGGNVTIATQGGILGFESQGRSTPLSDITASSEVGISGTVTLNAPDTNNLQNSLTQLPQSAIDTNALLANSCIVRNPQNGTFFITGTGGLPTNPGELSTYSTGTIQPTTAWKPGDAIVEPQGVYQLPNGQLVMSRECD